MSRVEFNWEKNISLDGSEAGFSEIKLYKQLVSGRTRLGISCAVDASIFDTRRLLGHEEVLAKKVEDLEKVLGRTELPPVMLLHRRNPTISRILECASCSDDFLERKEFPGGSEKTLLIPIEERKRLYNVLLDMPGFLIADGHHRVAAARRLYQRDQLDRPLNAVIFSEADAFCSGFIKLYRLDPDHIEIVLARFMGMLDWTEPQDLTDDNSILVRHKGKSLQFLAKKDRRGFQSRATIAEIHAAFERLPHEIVDYLSPESQVEVVDQAIERNGPHVIALRFPSVPIAEIWDLSMAGACLEPHSTYFHGKPTL